MCFAVNCDKCGKKTWKGCGRHAEQVMKGIPQVQRIEVIYTNVPLNVPSLLKRRVLKQVNDRETGEHELNFIEQYRSSPEYSDDKGARLCVPRSI
ncbi:hypothetical protein P5673_014082 [Acropora cervicornis]|uniref:Uncharacterized protein n=1 Tax=Acropora cervicornis TaxID=6130 RepID=A0AAD9V6E3_ACRCE|nr:hypothetical protein P5673_014082 [Acropora cervicornis]